MDSVIVIPALNPDQGFVRFVETVVEEGFCKVIVIDDGSEAEYRPLFQQVKSIHGVDLLVHEVNKGKGRALKDAFLHYIEQGYDDQYNGVITADADGQHSIQDIVKISKDLSDVEYKGSLILGERAFDKDVPLRSRFGNSMTAVLFRLLYRVRLHDTQTGLRGIPNAILRDLTDLAGDRYEYEMNMLIACARKSIPIHSVEIRTIYIDDNAGSHFNPVKDSIRIYKLLFGTFLKFSFVSLSSCLIDMLLFQIAVLVLKERSANYIVIATAAARVISAAYNFTMNHKLVFRSKEKMHVTAVKYIVLCVMQLLCSAYGVQLLYRMLGWPELLIKVIVDTALFLISYRIQKYMIFKE